MYSWRIKKNQKFSVSSRKGTLLLLKGVNGSGKTTFLRKCLFFIEQEGGTFIFNNNLLIKQKFKEYFLLKIHYLNSQYTLENWRFVFDYIQEWLLLFQIKIIFKKYSYYILIQKFNIFNYKNIIIQNLSLGQEKRLFLTKLWLIPKPIWFLDEPTLGLDKVNLKKLDNLIIKHQELGGILFLSSHINLNLNYVVSLNF